MTTALVLYGLFLLLASREEMRRFDLVATGEISGLMFLPALLMAAVAILVLGPGRDWFISSRS